MMEFLTIYAKNKFTSIDELAKIAKEIKFIRNRKEFSLHLEEYLWRQPYDEEKNEGRLSNGAIFSVSPPIRNMSFLVIRLNDKKVAKIKVEVK